MNEMEKTAVEEISTGNLIFSIFYLGLALAALAFLVFFAIKLYKTFRGGSTYPIISVQNVKNVRSAPMAPVNNFAAEQVPADLETTQKLAENKDKIQIGISSIIGTRKYQQDAVVACNKAFLHKNKFTKGIVVLCDGMGGMNGGEIASALTTKTIYEDYLKSNPTDIPKFLKEEVRKTDTMVYELKDELNRPMGSGSTLLCIVVDNGKLFWVSVGDSRIYIIRNREMVQVTEDHNYYLLLKKKAESGQITFEEAANDPKAEALISFIGIGKESPIDNNEQPFPLQDGDIVLLCSDGLYKTLPDEEILSTILRYSDNVESAAKMLTHVVQSKQKRGQDNTTVAVLKFLK